MTGYHIEAPDGDIGHVEDFIVDGEPWEIPSIIRKLSTGSTRRGFTITTNGRSIGTV